MLALNVWPSTAMLCPAAVLHGLVRMARQAIRLRAENARPKSCQHHDQPNRRNPGMSGLVQSVAEPLAKAQRNCDQECCDSCGFCHSAVFFPQVDEDGPLLTWLPRRGSLHFASKLLARIAPLRKVLCRKSRSDRGHKCIAINPDPSHLSRDLQHFSLDSASEPNCDQVKYAFCARH